MEIKSPKKLKEYLLNTREILINEMLSRNPYYNMKYGDGESAFTEVEEAINQAKLEIINEVISICENRNKF